jgi:hypothetical protein
LGGGGAEAPARLGPRRRDGQHDDEGEHEGDERSEYPYPPTPTPAPTTLEPFTSCERLLCDPGPPRLAVRCVWGIDGSVQDNQHDSDEEHDQGGDEHLKAE